MRRIKKNRNSDCGGLGPSLHTAGSIPITEHRRRLKEKLGEEPSHAALFQATHKRKKTDEFVCKKAQQVMEAVTQMQQTQPDLSLETQLHGIRLLVVSRKEGVFLDSDQIPNTTSRRL
nr:putative transposase En/Spm [Ipomoea batatas]